MPDLILHHYWESPYAEKIRRIFGFKGLAWKSAIIPMVAPKPDLTALTGGYRKTPVLQIGADIYCDTELIARVLERLYPEPTLHPEGTRALDHILMNWGQELFLLAIYVIGSSGDVFPEGFLEDRSNMVEGGIDPGRFLRASCGSYPDDAISSAPSSISSRSSWATDARSSSAIVSASPTSRYTTRCLRFEQCRRPPRSSSPSPTSPAGSHAWTGSDTVNVPTSRPRRHSRSHGRPIPRRRSSSIPATRTAVSRGIVWRSCTSRSAGIRSSVVVHLPRQYYLVLPA
jgi:hypothetical protein